jgi:neuroligin
MRTTKVHTPCDMARQIHVLNVLYVVTAFLKIFTAVSPSLSVFGVSIFIVSSVSAGIIYDSTSEGTYIEPIKIKQGKLVGQRLKSRIDPDRRAVEVYLGIPYAAPPTGSQRFMPPGSPPQWTGVKSADTFGPVCPQHLPDLNKRTKNAMSEGRVNYLRRLFPYLQRNQSEDCLYLNIYAPAQERGKYCQHIVRICFPSSVIS